MSGHPNQAAMPHACEPVESRIRRFPRSYRRRLRKLVRGSKPLSDLLYSFPGAAFILAAGNRSPEARGQAVQLLTSGRPLAEAAAALGVPMWLRRLPPEAFTSSFGDLPDDSDFGRRIVNLIPRAAEATPMWLAFGAEACDSELALWLAGQRIYSDEGDDGVPLLPLVMFAWFSCRRDELAHRFIYRPWHKQMPFNAAVQQTRVWLERVIVEYCIENPGAGGGWHKEHKSCGHRFRPLRTARELIEEGDRMRNCVTAYANKLALGDCLIYSIRRGGKRVATMEIVPTYGRIRGAKIAQLQGPGNSEPAQDVKRAAENWLSKRGGYPLSGLADLARLPVLASRWEAIWRPFCTARPQFNRRLLAPPTQALIHIYSDLRKLEQRHEA